MRSTADVFDEIAYLAVIYITPRFVFIYLSNNKHYLRENQIFNIKLTGFFSLGWSSKKHFGRI